MVVKLAIARVALQVAFAFPQLPLQLAEGLAIFVPVLLSILDLLHSFLSLILQLDVLLQHILLVHGVVATDLFVHREGATVAAHLRPALDRIAIKKSRVGKWYGVSHA